MTVLEVIAVMGCPSGRKICRDEQRKFRSGASADERVVERHGQGHRLLFTGREGYVDVQSFGQRATQLR